MKMFLVRHGKSDKSLQHTLSHDEFELKRALAEGEAEKAKAVGASLKQELENLSGYDFVFSGKMRSKQTVLAIAEGLGFNSDEAASSLREDFGLTYLADKNYWEACEEAVKNKTVPSHADFFLTTPAKKFFRETHSSKLEQTFSPEYMRKNMRSVIRRAFERNKFLGKEVSVMVSHEPVLSLCTSDLTDKKVSELGGSFSELEAMTLEFLSVDILYQTHVKLTFRNETYDVTTKIFDEVEQYE